MALAALAARADKYGVQEAMAESDSSDGWLGIVLALGLLLYLHFKDK